MTKIKIGTDGNDALTGDPKEQADLQTMKNAFFRQRALVTETNHVTFALGGFPTSSGYQVTRYLIDATHNNSYATYVSSGLSAAIAGQQLQVLDTQRITSLSQLPAVDLKPYSVDSQSRRSHLRRIPGPNQGTSVHRCTNACANENSYHPFSLMSCAYSVATVAA